MTTTKADERPILERAEAAIPGLEAAKAALRRVAEHIRKGGSPAVPVPEVVEEAADAVMAGDPIPDGLGRAVLAAQAIEQERLAEHGAMQSLRATLMRRIESAEAQHVDVALAVVRDELEAVLAAARAVDGALGDVRTPEAAMAAGSGAVDSWRTLLALVEKYDALRGAQLHLITPSFGGGGDITIGAMSLAGLFANAFDLYPDPQARAAGRPAPPQGFRDSLWAPPWPAPNVERGDQPGVWPTTDRPAYLRCVATSNAEPWVPTAAEMRAKAEEVAVWIRNGGRPEPDGPPAAMPDDTGDAFRRERKKAMQRVQEGEEQARKSHEHQVAAAQARARGGY